MLWFDFYCHDQELIARQMQTFMSKVAGKVPVLQQAG